MGKKALSLESMRTHITQVKALLRGDIADIDGGLGQILASDGQLPNRPINVPIYMAGQGPRARALAKEITDGLISLGGPAEGFETCLVSTNGTVLDDDEDVTSPRPSAALKPRPLRSSRDCREDDRDGRKMRAIVIILGSQRGMSPGRSSKGSRAGVPSGAKCRRLRVRIT
jgi:hypothetical protein